MEQVMLCLNSPFFDKAQVKIAINPMVTSLACKFNECMNAKAYL